MYNSILKQYPNGDIQYKFYDKSISERMLDDDDKRKELFDRDRYKELRELYYNDVCNEEIAKEFERLQLKQIQKWKLKEEHKEEHKKNIRFQNDKRDKQKIFDLARSNTWHWFGTFTFDGTKINRYDYEECYKKLSKWLMNVRNRKCKDLKYLCIPEQHKNGAWHFHCLLANTEELTFIRATNNNKDSKYYGLPLCDNKGREIYNIENFTIGFTNFSKVSDTRRVSMYIVKYITKSNCIKLEGRNRHLASRNLNKPTVRKSECTKEEIDEFLKSVEFRTKWKKEKTLAKGTLYENKVLYVEL